MESLIFMNARANSTPARVARKLSSGSSDVRMPLTAAGPPTASLDGAALEEKRGIGLQRAGDLHHAAAADTVGALLVFLHLLECEPELVAEPFLSLAQREPAAADAQADMAVRRVGGPFADNSGFCHLSCHSHADGLLRQLNSSRLLKKSRVYRIGWSYLPSCFALFGCGSGRQRRLAAAWGCGSSAQASSD